jgi:hypothetical protein
MGTSWPIDGAWRARVETGKPKGMIALCVGLWDDVWLSLMAWC